ncbi:MaoC dehydratase-like protein [Williamsia limnetica]|uniref:MaoC dehydratase-like protein n=1 Tax=Williamsia limnetica TaxID=882452 RepID=A0A318R9M2_WILLI|nr:MaoC family dehydratase N-terminal domain-containing protein [Williamsia limnetica]PYE12338.1 MaoC dehydratase-like protein [Williamsia limnetica]
MFVHEGHDAPSPGTVVDRVEFDVERGKIGEFAVATYAGDQIHRDVDVATAAGFDDVLATATHVVVAGHHRNQREFVAALGLAIERVVVGSVEWEYARPLVAGDHLIGTRRILDNTVRQGKRGGSMRLVTLQTDWLDSSDQLAVTQREVLIERGL